MKSLRHRIFGIMLCLCAFGAVAQESYTLSAGDEVSIVVFGEDDLTMDIKLNENGQINFPLLGAINASGMSVAELEATITRELSGAYLVNPDVRVSVAEYRQVFINGEVNAPGGYDYKPGLTLDKAIALAGGLTDRASTRRMFVVRAAEAGSQEKLSLADPVGPGDTVTIQEGFF